MNYIIQIIAAFLGSLGFAVLFNIKGKDIIWAALGGLLDWSVYLIANEIFTNEYIGYFWAALFLGIYSLFLARKNKVPTTLYLTVGFIPLIPGKSLFITMSSLVALDWNQALYYGIDSINIATAIASGIVTEIVVTNIYTTIINKKRRLR